MPADRTSNAVSVTTGIVAIFKRELRANRNRFLSWTIPLGILVFFAISIFPDMAKEGLIDMKMQALPEGLRNAMGFGAVDLNEAIGFYGSAISLYVTLVGGMFAALLGASALSKEESARTAEFLLSKPVSRGAIVLGKASAVFLYVLLFNLIISLISFAALEVYASGQYALDVFLWVSVAHTLVVASLAGVGFFASALLSKARTVLPIAMGAVLGTYLLGAFSQIGDGLAFLGWFSPFQYAESSAIIARAGLPPSALMLGVLAVGGVAGAYVLYGNKDISA